MNMVFHTEVDLKIQEKKNILLISIFSCLPVKICKQSENKINLRI